MRLLVTTLIAAVLWTAPAMAEPAPPAKGLFIVIYRQGPAWQADKPMRAQPAMKPHGAYMKKLFDAGVSFAAGPTTDTPGGLVILRADSLEQARAIMAADPGVGAGMLVGEVHGWTPAFRSDQPLPKGG